jgi:hypothetical protein
MYCLKCWIFSFESLEASHISNFDVLRGDKEINKLLFFIKLSEFFFHKKFYNSIQIPGSGPGNESGPGSGIDLKF